MPSRPTRKPSRAATGESSGGPRVALLVETSSSYGRGLLRGISRYARLHGPWSLYFEPSGPDQSLPRLASWGVQGVITRVHSRGLGDQILSLGMPAVDLGYVLPDLFPWRISNHQVQVAKLAAEHLLACGLRHFAFCGLVPFDPWAEIWESVREESFRAAIAAAGHKVDTYEWPKRKRDWAWSAAQAHLISWLESLPKPVGLMASDDLRGQHVLDAARLAGIAVPDELAVIGVDNDEVLCELTTPSLSSVELNLERIGYEGAALLDRLMRGQKAPKKPIRVEPLGVVARQSTDVLALDDEIVAAALRFIRQHVHRPIRVGDVLKEVSVSRKTLETRFQKAMGRTLHDEIERLRLARVKDLLVQTEWPLKRIAQASGFSYVEHLHFAFRRALGVTPREYREKHRGEG